LRGMQKREYNRKYREKNWENMRETRKHCRDKNLVSHFYTWARADFRYERRYKREIFDSDLK